MRKLCSVEKRGQIQKNIPTAVDLARLGRYVRMVRTAMFFSIIVYSVFTFIDILQMKL